VRRVRWTSQQVVERGQRAAACPEKEKKRERVGAGGRQTAPLRGTETPPTGQNEKEIYDDEGGSRGERRRLAREGESERDREGRRQHDAN